MPVRVGMLSPDASCFPGVLGFIRGCNRLRGGGIHPVFGEGAGNIFHPRVASSCTFVRCQRITERRQRVGFGNDPVVPVGYGLAEVEFEIVERS